MIEDLWSRLYSKGNKMRPIKTLTVHFFIDTFLLHYDQNRSHLSAGSR
jgi:hypothetical protein